MKKLLALSLLSLAAFAAGAQSAAPAPKTEGSPSSSEAPVKANPQDPNYSRPERGWFFFETKPKKEEPKKEEPPVEPLKPMPKDLPPPPKDEKCKKKETWSAECGFVNPGPDFEFQAKQRDALMERMVVANNDPKAVEAFQYYMRWVLERVSEVSNLWYYNMVQNPDLDPRVQQPISAMGLRLMTDVQQGKETEISKLLKDEGAFFVYFSRSDCNFCHQMAPLVKDLAKGMGLPVRNAALDAKCIPGLEEGCVANVVAPAQALQVSTVPTVFLYVPKQTWIRIATGLTDATSMKERAMQFFLAYRTALLKGVANGQGAKASVDFSGNESFMGGASKGVEGDGKGPRLPDEAEMAKLLGAK